LGELGGSDQQNCLNAINDALTHLEANRDVWYGNTRETSLFGISYNTTQRAHKNYPLKSQVFSNPTNL